MTQPPKRDDDKESRPSPMIKTTIDYDEVPEDKGSGLLVIGMLAAIVIIGGVLVFSMMASKKGEEGEGHTANAEETQEEPAPPDTAAEDTTSMANNAPPPPAPKKPEPAPTPTPAPAPEPSAFGIEVGSYLFEDKATEVLTTLSTSASVQGKVVPRDDGSFAVVLGPFDSRSAAESKGSELLASGAVRESRVVPLKE